MSEQQPEKFQIGWFKLAEFVARKERERAFGIYRLLVHSLEDDAFITQLEGDLLRAFNDDKASVVYQKAAQLYEARGDLIQAAALYEHCHTMHQKNSFYLKELVRIYTTLKLRRVMRYLDQLIGLLLMSDAHEEAIMVLEDASVEDVAKAVLYENVVIDFLSKYTFSEKILHKPLAYLQQLYMSQTDERLSILIAKLAALSTEAHAYMCGILKKDDTAPDAL